MTYKKRKTVSKQDNLFFDIPRKVSLPSVLEQVPSQDNNQDDYTYTDLLPSGDVVKMKMQSGCPVITKNLGKIKDFAITSLTKIMMSHPQEITPITIGQMTHLELSMLRLAQTAADGNLDATREVLDRLIGKPKQINENTNISVTLDDILMGRDANREQTTIVDAD